MPGHPLAQIARLERLPRLGDRGEARRLGEEVRRDQDQAAHAHVLDMAEIERGDRRAVAMAEQNAFLKADRVQHVRQHVGGLPRHVVERARQFGGIGPAVAGAREGEHAPARRLGQPLRESRATARREPSPSCSMTIVLRLARAAGPSSGLEPLAVGLDREGLARRPRRTVGRHGSAGLLPELETLDLAGRGLRQFVDDLDPARIFPFADRRP